MSRKGKKNFDKCGLKVVQFSDLVFPRGTKLAVRGELIVADKDARVLGEDDSSVRKAYGGSYAELHCPKTEDDRVEVDADFNNYNGRSRALKSLRNNAGETVCQNCVFFGMTELEVSEYRAKLVRSETERLDYLKLKTQTLAELAEIDPAYQQIGPED